MPFYEYKVVPAPERAPKVKGLKGAPKFAHAMETLMNELAQDGWEYLRAESLPDEEKKGLMGGKEIVTRNVLIFRRELYFEEPAEEAPKTAPMTLGRSARAEDAAEADVEADMDSIYAGAEEPGAAPEASRVERAPLVADRKGQGVDF